MPCTAVQRTTPPAGAYAFPHAGVLTRFSVRTGSSIATIGGEWMKARTFRLGDATHARVISESAQVAITLPSTADVLGPRPGGRRRGPSAVPGLRSGRARSQDLYLGDAAHATTACSGALPGSDLQGAYKRLGFSCGYNCARVQLTSGGVSTSPAPDGVVVRWRLQAPVAGDYHVTILEPAPSGGFAFARVSDTVTIPADEALWTFPARLPIRAGGYVAFVPPPFAIRTTFQTMPAGATYANVNDAPVGSSTTISPGVAGAFLNDADIEPDADRDGHGDVTQDAC